MENIIKILGLPADATQAQVEQAIAALAADNAGLKKDLVESNEKASKLQVSLNDANSKLEKSIAESNATINKLQTSLDKAKKAPKSEDDKEEPAKALIAKGIKFLQENNLEACWVSRKGYIFKDKSHAFENKRQFNDDFIEVEAVAKA
mgnify:CR=1 FL=1